MLFATSCDSFLGEPQTTIGSLAFPFFFGEETIGSRFDGYLSFTCLVVVPFFFCVATGTIGSWGSLSVGTEAGTLPIPFFVGDSLRGGVDKIDSLEGGPSRGSVAVVTFNFDFKTIGSRDKGSLVVSVAGLTLRGGVERMGSLRD